MVNLTLPFSAGAVMSTVLPIDRSAFGTSTPIAALLFAGSGSRVVLVAVAVLVTGVWTVTRASMSSVAVAPFASVPTFQAPAA